MVFFPSSIITFTNLDIVLSLNFESNSISLLWTNPEITGVDDEIFYTLEREWDVGGFTYNDIIVDSLYGLNFEDNFLLNSTEYSYRIKATNSTGISNWSDYLVGSSVTLTSDAVEGFSGDTYQTIVPPDNVVELNWLDLEDVNYSNEK